MTAMQYPNISMIGLGYIGLPSAAVIADAGCKVTGVDISQHVVDTVNRGDIHIEENDLDTLVRKVVKNGLLRATLVPVESDIFVIAVPTPFKEDHRPDISYVLAAAEAIAKVLKPGNLIILESTSPIGTTKKIAEVIANARPDLRIAGVAEDRAVDVHVAYCPERVLPGKIVAELISNDRSIGGLTPECAKRARKFYEIFVKGECIETAAATAEMVKLVENASRDVSIAFANELSLIADRVGIDVWEVIALANRHPRVNILQPGPGVGGHCIAVDPWFLVDSAPSQSAIIRAAREINDGKSDYVAERVREMAAQRPDAKIACLGLAFKANIDDFRESPALKIVAELAREYGERMQIVEPYCTALPKAVSGSKAQLVELDKALSECDIIVLLVDHSIFASVRPAQLAGKAIYDTRGQWYTLMKEAGYRLRFKSLEDNAESPPVIPDAVIRAAAC